MTVEGNKELVRRLTEAWNDRDREAWVGTFAEEVLVHGDDDERVDRAEMADAEWGYFGAFPDATATTEHLVAEDELVVVRWAVAGTHEGEIRGIEPTGREVEYEEWAMYRVEDGAIVETWSIADALDVFDQLGAVDPPSA
jgi:predicted ester cyclase